jgi:hypothetical protein
VTWPGFEVYVPRVNGPPPWQCEKTGCRVSSQHEHEDRGDDTGARERFEAFAAAHPKFVDW